MIRSEALDSLWGELGDAQQVEQALRHELDHLDASEISLRAEVLSQIALALAVQRRFDDAHRTLDLADSQSWELTPIARVRILLERGRVVQQEGDLAKAREWFEKAFAISAQNRLDFHTINIAHMIAIVEPGKSREPCGCSGETTRRWDDSNRSETN